MFGNRLGWIISGFIVLAFAGMLYGLSRMQDPSAPTPAFAADPANLAPLQLPVAPETVVPTMTAPGDAAEKYREVIDDVEAHPGDYKEYVKGKTATLKGVLALVEAGPVNEMKLFSKKPREVLNYKFDKDAIEDLKKAGDMTAAVAQSLSLSGDTDKAMKFAEAVFGLGAKLYNERVTYEELTAGLGQMEQGVRVIKSIASKTGDTARISQCDAFAAAEKAYDAKTIKPLNALTSNMDDRILATRAGDLFLVATDSKERLWRSEAMLQLGRMRFYIGEGRAADQHYAMRLVRKFAGEEKDEIVRYAATIARDLDLPTYNSQTASHNAQ